ncbi:MAG: hypothetical protein JNJ54_14090 [Myxococcaceae bacterium]|nr:hypothetical protein [Myxococcaceae bacterium]
MSPRVPSVLVLDGADVPPVFQARGGVVHRAYNMLQAGALLASVRPDVVLIDAARRWHLRFVQALPAGAGPPVVALGESPELRGSSAQSLSRAATDEQLVAALVRVARAGVRPGEGLADARAA